MLSCGIVETCFSALAVVSTWFAANGAGFLGGTGSVSDPYKIGTPEQLISIGADPDLLGKHYILVHDIDLDPNLPGGRTFAQAVIAPDADGELLGFQGTAFTGSFDGDGHAIRCLTIRGERHHFLGLFGALEGSSACIRNLTLQDVVIRGPDDSEGMGGLTSMNSGTIVNCRVEGIITGGIDCGGLVGYNGGSLTGCQSQAAVYGYRNTGGLVGENSGDITACCATGSVSGNFNFLQSGHFGGLVGWNRQGTITACFADANVVGGADTGGLVGSLAGGTIRHCYARGNIYDAGGGVNFGGLVGMLMQGEIAYSYSVSRVPPHLSCGGLIGGGAEETSVLHSLWDVETSGIRVSMGGTGLTTAEMMDPQVYTLNGWGGDPNWVMPSEGGYPSLAWEGKPGEIIPTPAVDWLEGRGTPGDPYRIATAEQLAVLGKTSLLWNQHFLLVNDIDMDPNMLAGQVFARAVIAPDESLQYGFQGEGFAGTFDGGGHAIQHLSIRGGKGCYLGLFGKIEARGRVLNLGLTEAFIEGWGWEGALAGLVQGEVARCYATGRISTGDRGENVGGLAGENAGSIGACHATCEVSGGISSKNLGGLVGWNSRGYATNCCAEGKVFGLKGSDSLGGLIGCNGANITGPGRQRNIYIGRVTNCYATGAVFGSTHLGGLVGRNIEAPPHWNAPSPLVGCYFLATHDGGGPSNGLGEALPAGQMKQQASFAGWSFDTVWTICEGKGYPHLRWEDVQCEE